MAEHTCPACGDAHSPARLGGLKRVIGNVVAILAVPAALIGIWTFHPFEEHVCRAPVVGAWIASMCEDGDVAVTTAQANAFLAEYRGAYHADSGIQLSADAGPRAAWQLLTADYRAQLDYNSFAAGVVGVIWEEPVGSARRLSAFNRFDTRFRVYTEVPKDGRFNHVITYDATVDLTTVAGKVEMSSQWINSRIGRTATTLFPREQVLATPVEGGNDTYTDIDPHSPVTMYTQDATHPHGDDAVGGKLTVLCRIEVTRGNAPSVPLAADGTWTRVPQGWMMPGSLRASPEQVDPVPPCDRDALPGR